MIESSVNPAEGHDTAAQPTKSLIVLERVSYAYRMGNLLHPILHDLSLTIERGQSCALIGASGSGKSTLLNLLGLLDRPISGRLLFEGRDMSLSSEEDRADLRNKWIGFVFQSFNLLPRLTALDNVAMPLLYRGCSRADARQQALHQLQGVGLIEKAGHLPAELSGGQRQRVAIARALVGDPTLILADEPTGNLDRLTADEVLDLLLKLNRESATTLVMVTHDEILARRMERRIRVENGTLVELDARQVT